MIKGYNQYINEELNLGNFFKKKKLEIPLNVETDSLDLDSIDPYGEEDWDDDELITVLKIAKKRGLPYDQITKLYCSGKELTSLEGIENLQNLQYLFCNRNNLTTLKGVENLSNLQQLQCSNNNLNSLEGIENLKKLKILWCDRNNLTNLYEIENLSILRTLVCSNNNFSTRYKQHLIEYCKKKKILLSI